MVIYHVKMKYSEGAVTALCGMQSRIYGRIPMLCAELVSVVLLSAALTLDLFILWKVILLLSGVLIFSFVRHLPTYRARSIAKSWGGEPPETAYTFSSNDILLESKGRERRLSYETILRVIHDERYLYLFTARNAAYLVPKDQITPGDPDGLLRLLTEKTGRKARFIPGTAGAQNTPPFRFTR